MKTLLIVESPTKAIKIQEYLGDAYVVKSSSGHIRDLSNVKKIGVDVENGFKPYYKFMENKKYLLDELINAAIICNKILLGTDDDREGCKIADDLKILLESTGKPIKRIIFNAVTKDAIFEAIKNPIEIDRNLVQAQQARRVLDRIVGYSVSPFLMSQFSTNLSAGRVQSVAVKMICDREKEINSFLPKEYWNLYLNLIKDGLIIKAKCIDKISSEDELISLKKGFTNNVSVVSVSCKDKYEKAPPPLITSKLQQIASNKFSFDTEKIMKSAQNLYEHGYVTYIRTDSVNTSEPALNSLRKWIKANKLPISKKTNFFKDKKAAQGAHECIRPTNIDVEKVALDQNDQKIYDLIRKYFIASQMDDAIFSITEVVVSDGSRKFKICGKTLKQKGFLEIFKFNNSDDIIPCFVKGEVVNVCANKPFDEERKFTQPLPRFNDASLIKELEKRQIGRPATFAQILKVIMHRNYVEKNGSTYHSTQLGEKVTDLLSSDFQFMDYLFTSKLEEELDDIAEGKSSYIEVLQKFYNVFKTNMDNAYFKRGAPACSKCGGYMIKKVNKENKEFFGCNRYPNCINAQSIEIGVKDK